MRREVKLSHRRRGGDGQQHGKLHAHTSRVQVFQSFAHNRPATENQTTAGYSDGNPSWPGSLLNDPNENGRYYKSTHSEEITGIDARPQRSLLAIDAALPVVQLSGTKTEPTISLGDCHPQILSATRCGAHAHRKRSA
jgi:hypothetical protein